MRLSRVTARFFSSGVCGIVALILGWSIVALVLEASPAGVNAHARANDKGGRIAAAAFAKRFRDASVARAPKARDQKL